MWTIRNWPYSKSTKPHLVCGKFTFTFWCSFFIELSFFKLFFLRLKDKTRTSEKQVLLQGTELPATNFTAKDPLPSAKPLGNPNPCLQNPLIIEDPPDNTGMAAVRVRQVVHQQVPQELARSLGASVSTRTTTEEDDLTEKSPDNSSSNPDPHPKEKKVSRTTAWRKRNAAKAGVDAHGAASSSKSRKEYGSSGCKICQKPLQSDGHRQYYGHRYCPQDTRSYDQWKLQTKNAMAAKNK